MLKTKNYYSQGSAATLRRWVESSNQGNTI